MSARLGAEGLTKTFAGRAALDGVSFTVDTAGVVGLLGPNGAGKTTTFKLLLGMLRPSAGRAEIGGHDCTNEPTLVRSVAGYMPDEPAFYDYLSGRETLAFVAEVRGLDPAAMWRWLDPLVHELAAETVLEGRCGAFSLGMRKKLALLVALAHQPKILLLDEPTNGLDPPSAAGARALFQRLAREHDTTVLLSTHLLDLAEKSCDRLLVLDRGKLVGDGSLAELRRVRDESLEAVFMRLVGKAPVASET
ncbi:MAG: ABC transporter ATP-binding protein [Deltaproteobacteria bacterium]|nr:ABC transporter ATP-binding protein [Deltaproteobacteria bacterium]